MDGFFNQYLNDKTQKGITMTTSNRPQTQSQSRSRSRSRSRDRDKKRSKETPLDEEQRYNIEKYSAELKKKTFDENKRKELEQNALKKCAKRTTKSDLETLKERYLR